MSNSNRYDMQGIRQQPSGKYFVRVSNGYRRNGKRNMLTGTADTLSEAKQLRLRFMVQAGKYANAGDDMTLDEYYYVFFVPGRKDKLTRATMQDYQAHYEKHIAPVFGFRKMASIKSIEIQQLVNSKSRATASHIVKTLRAILRDAWLNEFLDIEPMRKPIDLPAQNEQRGVWTAEQVAQAMEILKDTRIEALWLLMVGAGLRREEAYALFWRDLNFERVTTITGQDAMHCTATIDDAVTIADGRKDVKTAFSRRYAVVAEPFASRLYELRKAPDAPICNMPLKRIGKVWRAMWKEPPKRVDGEYFEYKDNKYMQGRMFRTDIPYIQLSRMRATHETLMQAAGISDTLNARMHGRSESSKIGYRHYLNPDVSTFKAASQALEDVMKQAKSS